MHLLQVITCCLLAHTLQLKPSQHVDKKSKLKEVELIVFLIYNLSLCIHSQPQLRAAFLQYLVSPLRP